MMSYSGDSGMHEQTGIDAECGFLWGGLVIIETVIVNLNMCVSTGCC